MAQEQCLGVVNLLLMFMILENTWKESKLWQNTELNIDTLITTAVFLLIYGLCRDYKEVSSLTNGLTSRGLILQKERMSY